MQLKFDDNDVDNEPPLLEELGVNFEHIRLKTFAVLNPMAYASSDVAADQDLAGPLVLFVHVHRVCSRLLPFADVAARALRNTSLVFGAFSFSFH